MGVDFFRNNEDSLSRERRYWEVEVIEEDDGESEALDTGDQGDMGRSGKYFCEECSGCVVEVKPAGVGLLCIRPAGVDDI